VTWHRTSKLPIREDKKDGKDEKMYLQVEILKDGEKSMPAVLMKVPREKRERDAPQRSRFQPFHWKHPNEQHLHEHDARNGSAVNFRPILPSRFILGLVNIQNLAFHKAFKTKQIIGQKLNLIILGICQITFVNFN